MSLSAGTRLGAFEILAPLGKGGMGEVYRARDTKLEREVAIKVLPDALTQDPERLARFQREATLLAALNHPHIGSIYGLEEAEGKPFLVLELAPGEDLSDRIERGPIPVDEAVEIARQIAEALEEAHEKGIVHRDLKPANIKLTQDGKVKVLDFGLAKAYAADETGATDVSQSPTMSARATAAGLLLGTAAYMSPEQARGKPVDKRADIWAFGVVLFEMLTGENLFSGETVSDTLASILKEEPDWTLLPADTPRKLSDLLHRCLRMDVRNRLHDIGDARIEIEEALSEPALSADTAAPRGRSGIAWLGWIAAAAALVLAGFLARPTVDPVTESRLTRFGLSLPEEAPLALLDVPILGLSPDGRHLAFTSVDPSSGRPSIYLRPMDQMKARLVANTEGGSSPFFSPDGRHLAFFDGDNLKKVPVDGGEAFTIAAAPNARGGVWTPDGSEIFFSPDYTSGIWRVSAAGGTPEPVVVPDDAAGERTFRWPDLLPSGRTVLYTVGSVDTPNNYDAARIEAFSLDTGERHVLVDRAHMARFVPPNRLVFSRSGVLFSVSFDLEQLEIVGQPAPVVQGVGGDPSSGAGYFDLSNDGTLAFVPGSIAQNDAYLTLVSRDGERTRLPLEPRGLNSPRFSPDGHSLAFTVSRSLAGADGNIWIYSFETGGLDRLTFGDDSIYSAYTPDGLEIAYQNVGSSAIFVKPVDGSAAEEQLTPSGQGPLLPEAWSPDGRTLAYTRIAASTDIYLVTRGEEPRLFEVDACCARFSPDGRWIAYSSPASGGVNIFVRPVSGDGKWQVTQERGSYHHWSKVGSQILYIATNEPGRPVRAVDVTTGETLRFGPPRTVIERTHGFVTATAPKVNWSAAPDGSRFVFVEFDRGPDSSSSIEVVLGWSTDVSGGS